MIVRDHASCCKSQANRPTNLCQCTPLCRPRRQRLLVTGHLAPAACPAASCPHPAHRCAAEKQRGSMCVPGLLTLPAGWARKLSLAGVRAFCQVKQAAPNST